MVDPGALDPRLKESLEKIAKTIRALSIDGVQKANSGHPGLPLGCAEIGAYLYGHALRHNPKDSSWVNRDRLILSAGHGSMWLYSCLHLAGFRLPLEQLKEFRQLHSHTPGHPEAHETDGVEATTGPLGQGVGNAVGQALALKVLGARFNTPMHKIFDAKVYCLCSDGCIMEGISSEACSFAGHLKLDNLILIYDANHISLDGPLSDSCSEDTVSRYRAYGFDVYEVDGHSLDELHKVLSHVRKAQVRPCLIKATTIIGKGSPHKAGSHKVHGSPLGEEEVKLTKEALGIPLESFFVPQAVRAFFETKLQQDAKCEEEWRKGFEQWGYENPGLFQEFERMHKHFVPKDLEEKLQSIPITSPIASRTSSQMVLHVLGDLLPQLIGGSADLSSSDMTLMKQFPIIAPGNFKGRNIKFGVREFAMCTIATGMAENGMWFPYIGTFLTFSDYMRNGIRLAAMQKAHVAYQFTHDSIFLGEDGPTHQPIEHLASLRAMPNLHVIRPADANEVKMSWVAAVRYQGPSALILSRQNLPEIPGTKVSYEEGVGKGAYILKKEKKKPDFTLFATGSEVSLALQVAAELENLGKDVRVVSVPCWELFDLQEAEYKQKIIGGNLGKRVSIEAASDFGWQKFIGTDGVAIAMEGFGASAPIDALAKEFGFTVDAILERIL